MLHQKNLLGSVSAIVLGAIAIGCQSIGVSMSRGVNEYIEIQHFDDHSETNHVLEVVDREDYNLLGKTGNAIYYGIEGIGHGFSRGLDRYKAYRENGDEEEEDTALVEFMETLQGSINCPIDGVHKILPEIIAGFFSGMGRGWDMHKGEEDQEILYDYILHQRLKDRERRRKKLPFKPEIAIRHTDKGGQEIVIDTTYLNNDNITTDHIMDTLEVYDDLRHRNGQTDPDKPTTKVKLEVPPPSSERPQKVETQPSVSAIRIRTLSQNSRTRV